MKTGDLIRSLRAEEQQLLQKLHAVRFALEAYGAEYSEGSAAEESVSSPEPSPALPTEGVPSKYLRPSAGHSKAKDVLATVANFIVSRGYEPQTLKAIFEHVTSMGHSIGGQRPRATLSAMLSNSGQFDNLGRNSWILVDPPTNTQEVVND